MRIEATYLAKKLPKNLKKLRHETIEQGYLSNYTDAVRIRKKGDEYSFTRKTMSSPGDFSFRDYTSVSVYKEEFEKVWKLVIKKLSKVRYYYDQNWSKIDTRIDVFEGSLKGLILIELVFNSEDDLRNFTIPEWFGPEITDDKLLTNPKVAGKYFKDIEPIIKKYFG